jgi:hypothetical protein
MTESNYDKKEGNAFTNFLQTTGGMISSATTSAWEFIQTNIFPAVSKGADWVMKEGLPATGNMFNGLIQWSGQQISNIAQSFQGKKGEESTASKTVEYQPQSYTQAMPIEAPTTPVAQQKSQERSK